MDRYAKVILTIIAAALIYLCVVLTPLPALQAQQGSPRPGEGARPAEVIVVGWRAPDTQVVPVAVSGPVRIGGTVEVRGQVATEPVERAARVVIVGYEETTTREKSSGFRSWGPTSGLPTSTR